MNANRLRPLLQYDRSTEPTRYGAPKLQWIFRPTGEARSRLFFLWLDENGSLGGTRCRDDFTDVNEPWQWHAYLPQRFLRVLLTLLPPGEVARATYARMTHDFINFPTRET